MRRRRHLRSAQRIALAACTAALVGGTAATAHAVEFVIGEHVPLSGRLAWPGTRTHQGLMLAVEEYNRRQKVNTARLITIDDQSDPAKAVAAVEELLAKGVVAFAGGYSSGLVGPASEAAIRGGGVYLTPGGASKALGKAGGRYFSYATSDGAAAPWISFLPAVGVKKVSLIVMKSEGVWVIGKDAAEALRKKGVEVLVHEYDPGIDDFKPLLNLIKVKDAPDAILVSAYEKDSVAIMRAAQVVRPAVRVIGGTSGWASQNLVKEQGALMRNSVGGGFMSFPPRFRTPELKRFSESYQAAYGGFPDQFNLWGYDVVMLMLSAMERAQAAGRLDADTIAKVLRNEGKPQACLGGTATFDELGFNTSFTYRIAQHVPDGLLVVWPPEFADGKVTLPARSW